MELDLKSSDPVTGRGFKSYLLRQYVQLMELVDMSASSTDAAMHVGSSPTLNTNQVNSATKCRRHLGVRY